MAVFVSLAIFGLTLNGIEITRFASVDNTATPSGRLIWPLGIKFSAFPHEGTSHGGTASLISNKTMQQKDLVDIEWRLLKFNDQPVQAGSGPKAHLRLLSDGRKVEGFTGCNGLRGHYELASQNVRFLGLATTRKFCLGLMEQERAFVNGLERTRRWKAEDGQLVLMTEDNKAVLAFQTHTHY